MHSAVMPIKDENYDEVETLRLAVLDHVGKCYVMDDSVKSRGPALGYWPGSRSLGASLLDGMRRAAMNNSERVVTIDAGGSHDPDDIPCLLAVDADVVIGSRFCPGGSHNGPAWRRAGSRAVSGAFNFVHDRKIADWTSGFRAYSAKAVDTILMDPPGSKRHAVQAEMLSTCLQHGLSVVEVPIDYLMGESSFNAAAAREMLGLWWTELGWV